MSLETLSIDDIVEEINDLLDKSWALPLSGGRSVVNGEKVRDLLEQITLTLPGEIRQAQGIVSDRNKILDEANETARQTVERAEAKAKSIIEDAQQRAQQLVEQERISLEAKEYAQNVIKDANQKVRDLKSSALTFALNLLSETERDYRDSLTKLAKARENLTTAGEEPAENAAK